MGILVQGASGMRERSWSAEVGGDRTLSGLWFGMHGLAGIAILLCALWLSLPLWGMALIVSGVGGCVYISAVRFSPASWFESGHLALRDGSARWQAKQGRGDVVEGRMSVVWRGTSLVGIAVEAASGHRFFWLTPRRVGDVAWWQLQRWLRLNE